MTTARHLPSRRATIMFDVPSTNAAITRRAVIAGTIGVLVAPRFSFGQGADAAEIARVQKIAKKAGLGAFGDNKNDQYLALGDAPESFRRRALEILDGLARDYLKYFTNKGFAVNKPAGRMTTIVLANRRAFSAYLGEDVPGLVGGIYDPDANDLVLFDNQAVAGNLQAQKDNTLVLTHEATHQLTFSTGLLRRGGDVPKVIAEGLANYVEVRSPNGRDPKIGDVNLRRLAAFAGPGRAVVAPIAELVRDDARLNAPAIQQLAYSEAWLLVHFLMKTPRMLLKFQAYLKAIAPRNNPLRRMDDWVAHFGNPKATDRDLAVYLQRELNANVKKLGGG